MEAYFPEESHCIPHNIAHNIAVSHQAASSPSHSHHLCFLQLTRCPGSAPSPFCPPWPPQNVAVGPSCALQTQLHTEVPSASAMRGILQLCSWCLSAHPSPSFTTLGAAVCLWWLYHPVQPSLERDQKLVGLNGKLKAHSKKNP